MIELTDAQIIENIQHIFAPVGVEKVTVAKKGTSKVVTGSFSIQGEGCSFVFIFPSLYLELDFGGWGVEIPQEGSLRRTLKEADKALQDKFDQDFNLRARMLDLPLSLSRF